MTDQKQAPERRDLKDICFTLRQTSLHRAAEIIETLAKQRDEALAASAAREIAMRDRAAERIESIGFSAGLIRSLPLSPDATAALNEMLADAWEEGWEAFVRDNHIDTLTPNPYRKDATWKK